MRLKIILILFLLILPISLIMSEDTTTDDELKSNRAFEFSTGGGFNHSFVLAVWDLTYKNDGDTIHSISAYPYDHAIGFIIPTSFVFYPVRFFGIGGIYILGCELELFNGFYPYYITIQNKFRVINKFGNFNGRKKWFLLEYGISFYNEIPISIYNNILCFGPSLFIGYEKIFDKPFAFSIGFSFDGLYYKEPAETYSSFTINEFLWFLYFGIEARFRFAFLKELKK